MDSDEAVKVSVLANAQDVHLLREIAKWRRAEGIDYWRSHGKLGRFTQWSRPGLEGPQVSIDFLRSDDGWYAEMSIGTRSEFANLKVHDCWTLTQAIDALVAVGYLPPRFSSAYRAGWDRANKFALDREAGRRVSTSEFADLVPAVEVVW